MEVKAATSAEQTLGSLSSTGGLKLQRIIFIIIESGMALFAIQLARIVITSLVELQAFQTSPGTIIALNFVNRIHVLLNVIIRSVHFLLLLFY